MPRKKLVAGGVVSIFLLYLLFIEGVGGLVINWCLGLSGLEQSVVCPVQLGERRGTYGRR
jgi:hypothetical protein